MKTQLSLILVLILLGRISSLASLTFMDITPGTFTPGIGAASWTGSLNGVGVTGSLAGGANVAVNAVAPGIGFSTIVNDSPQWSYPIYTSTSALDDRIGFSQGPGGPGAFTVTFASPMSNLYFHVANLDLSFFDFTPSGGSGLTGLTLISGNGAAGDGLAVSVPTIFDMSATADGTPPTSPPPGAGPRSAYGTVRLDGTYTTLTFLTTFTGGVVPENANFTFSVPEPGVSALAAMSGLGILLRRRRIPA